MSSVGIFSVILPLISSVYFKYPNTPNTVYKDTTIVIVMLRTLGQPRKWWGFFILFSTGITCTKVNFLYIYIELKKQSIISIKYVIVSSYLQHRYPRWQIIRWRRTKAIVRSRRLASRGTVFWYHWRYNRESRRNRSSWKGWPRWRTAPWTSNFALAPTIIQRVSAWVCTNASV